MESFFEVNLADGLEGPTPVFGQSSSDFELEDGVAFAIKLGQYQGYNLRTELEYSYRQNDSERATVIDNLGGGLTLNGYDIDGDLQVHAGMFNMIWQFSNVPSRWIKPYVGAGVGFAFMDANLERLGQSVFTDGRSGNSTFAYQAIAGVNTQLSRSLDVFVEYRYFMADALTLETDFNAITGAGSSLLHDFDFQADNIMFGVRLKF